jgi:hypothetical protein
MTSVSYFMVLLFICLLGVIRKLDDVNAIFNDIFSPVLRGRPSSKRSIHICGRPRWVFVLFFSAGV